MNVAPLAGAWIETYNGFSLFYARKMSRPSRARGLKRTHPELFDGTFESRPSRARGLKPISADEEICAVSVAPLAGAWIETREIYF